MDELRAALGRITDVLQRQGVRFHVTGGLASSLYGEPRFTQDIDVVVRLEPASEELERLLAALAESHVVDLGAARHETAIGGMFQALDLAAMVKIDLHVGEAVPGELDRSVVLEVLPGLELPVVSREDAVLSKLIWIRQGSHKSRGDVVGILRRGGALDRQALAQRAQDLGLDQLLAELQSEAEA